MGYLVGHALLDTRNFLLPQRRNRCWIWATLDSGENGRSSGSRAHGRSSGSRDSKFSCSVSALLSHLATEPPSLEDFLTASVPADDKEDLVTGGRAGLSDREKDVVENVRQQLLEQMPPQRFQQPLDLVIDVSKSLGRAPWCVRAATCVLPNSRLYWQRQDRAAGLDKLSQVLLSRPR